MEPKTNEKKILIFDPSENFSNQICRDLSTQNDISIKAHQFLKSICTIEEYNLIILYITNDDDYLFNKFINNLSNKNKSNILIILKEFDERLLLKLFF